MRRCSFRVCGWKRNACDRRASKASVGDRRRTTGHLERLSPALPAQSSKTAANGAPCSFLELTGVVRLHSSHSPQSGLPNSSRRFSRTHTPRPRGKQERLDHVGLRRIEGENIVGPD